MLKITPANIVIGLLSLLIVTGCGTIATRKPANSFQTVTYTSVNLEKTAPTTIDVPNLNDVKSIQIDFDMPTPNPKPFLPNSSQNKAKISRLLTWLKSAKPLGYEKPHPIPMLGPTSLDIQLVSGRTLQLQPAFDTVTTFYDGNARTLELHPAKNEIDFVYQDINGKPIRLYCPKLYTWLVLNGWNQDIPWKGK